MDTFRAIASLLLPGNGGVSARGGNTAMPGGKVPAYLAPYQGLHDAPYSPKPMPADILGGAVGQAVGPAVAASPSVPAADEPPPVTSADFGQPAPAPAPAPAPQAAPMPAPAADAGPVDVPPMPDPVNIRAATGTSPQDQGFIQRLLANLAARDPKLPQQMAQGQLI